MCVHAPTSETLTNIIPGVAGTARRLALGELTAEVR